MQSRVGTLAFGKVLASPGCGVLLLWRAGYFRYKLVNRIVSFAGFGVGGLQPGEGHMGEVQSPGYYRAMKYVACLYAALCGSHTLSP